MDVSVIKLVLRRHVAIFERCADCTPLLGLLRANKMIDEYKYQHISAQRTPIERNRYDAEMQLYIVYVVITAISSYVTIIWYLFNIIRHYICSVATLYRVYVQRCHTR